MGFAFGIIFGIILLASVELGVAYLWSVFEHEIRKPPNIYELKSMARKNYYKNHYHTMKDEQYDDSGNKTETETTGDSE